MTETGRKHLENTPLEDNALSVVGRIQQYAHLIRGEEGDFRPLLQRIGDAPVVLLGEASHGTHEFYAARAEITRRLIEEKGFSAVAVEADWPDAYRANRFVHGMGMDQSSQEALGDFVRFPAWMWRNPVVEEFITWLRAHNGRLSAPERTSFYGLDLYSLQSSMSAVVDYLDKVDPEAAQRARFRYSCFDHFGEDPQTYGYASSFNLTSTCEQEVLEQLVDLRRQSAEYLQRDGFVAADEFFFAEGNARVARNAEQYYRSMFASNVRSWNLRDRHMLETLHAQMQHLEGQGRRAKVVVWAHNSHLGDARATEMSDRGELNLGQLVRQHYGADAVLVGMTTYTGTVTAASDWGGRAERKRVRPALAGSYENLLHAARIPAFSLLLSDLQHKLADLNVERLERAIGVIYRPETERISHYFNARLMEQFDVVLHFDETRALQPLELTSEWEAGEAPETYPSGL